MRIRVTTEEYNYMGLACGQEFEDDVTLIQSARAWDHVRFVNRGKVWVLRPDQYEVVEPFLNSKGKGPIQSDGGSSTYYDIEIEDWLLNLLNERQKEDKCYIKTEELIECGFSSDFDFANAFKSLVRAFGAMNGGGKAGNDVDYEMNKVQYSANKIKQRNQRKGEIGE